MAMVAKATQYKGDIQFRKNDAFEYNSNETYYISLRITPAIFSAMTSPLLFAASRCLKISSLSSACVGILLSTDITLLTEGRFILSDGVLHFFVALHIFALCYMIRKSSLISIILDGITLGFAISCKYTALGLVAIDGISQLVWIFVKRPDFWNIVKKAFLILFPTFAVFYSSWIIHFIITPYKGHCYYYLEEKYQSTLVDRLNEDLYYWGDRLIKYSLLERIIIWNIKMNSINMRSNIPHPAGSNPIYWPLYLDKWINFYSGPNDRHIFCMGNPFLYWITFAGIIFALILWPFGLADYRNGLFLLGWLVSYLPFVLVPRTMFIYHYLIPLMFGILNLCTLVENMFKGELRYFVNVSITLASLSCFIYFSPFIFGLPCQGCMDTKIWTKRWEYGPPKKVNTYVIEVFNTSEIYGSLPF